MILKIPAKRVHFRAICVNIFSPEHGVAIIIRRKRLNARMILLIDVRFCAHGRLKTAASITRSAKARARARARRGRYMIRVKRDGKKRDELRVLVAAVVTAMRKEERRGQNRAKLGAGLK